LLHRGVEVDALSWTSETSPEGYSYGRFPDGEGGGLTLTPTPNEPNRRPSSAPQTLFPSDQVVDVHLEITPSDWQAMIADPLSLTEYRGAIQYGMTRLEDVSIRVKGNSSLFSVSQSASHRFSFKVDMNAYVKGQRLLGVKKLNFNNGFKDPTLIRESVAYDVFREAGRPVPQTAFVNLTISGEHLGVYTVVEQVDDLFLERHFGDADGALYKPEMPAGLLNDRGDDIQRYEGLDVQSDEDTTDHDPFLSFIDEINRPEGGDLDRVLDVDGYLMDLAINVILINLDSYLGMGHNYYLYERSGVFTQITWDLNEAFGNFTCGCDRSQLVNYLIDEPTCGPTRARPLVATLLDQPMYLERYHQHLRALMDGPCSAASLSEMIHTKADLIRPYVERDPTLFFSVSDFDRGLTTDVSRSGEGGFGSRAWGLTSLIEDRLQSIDRQLSGELMSANGGEGNCGSRQGDAGPGGPGGGPPGQMCPPCGDGTCDMFEQNNPDVCPRDCQPLPASGTWCGDGICDALEACQRDCSADCP